MKKPSLTASISSVQPLVSSFGESSLKLLSSCATQEREGYFSISTVMAIKRKIFEDLSIYIRMPCTKKVKARTNCETAGL